MGQTNRRTDGVQCIMRPPSGRPQAWIRFVATQNTVSYNIAVLRRLYSRISTRSSALQHVRFCINILRRRVHYTNPLVYTGWPRSHYIILWRIKRRLSYCQCTRLKLVPPSQRGDEWTCVLCDHNECMPFPFWGCSFSLSMRPNEHIKLYTVVNWSL